jgi:WhiB family redox-sensing transcriptional regulator
MAIRHNAEFVTVAKPGYGGHSEVHALAIVPPGWTGDALCAQTDPDSFFPEQGGSTREAKAVCRSCPVQVECLDYALANEERFGIWGGVSERDRRKLHRRTHRPPDPEPPDQQESA